MWKITRASVIGTSHAECNMPCQDSCYANVANGTGDHDYLVCVVSDGAGTASLGGEGAELACRAAILAIETSLKRPDANALHHQIVEDWLNEVRRTIYDVVRSGQKAMRDYACTLLGAVVGDHQAIFFQIGDGAIVASTGDTQGVVFWPDSGQYANMTFFVTEEDALSHLHVSVTTARIDEVALFSDGLQRLALSLEQRAPHTPFFDPMFSVLRRLKPDECEAIDEQLVRFLNSGPVNARTSDDKTLVLATRRSP
jgi:hypothetical protein